MISFDKTVVLRVFRITNQDPDAQIGTKARSGEGKVAAWWASHQARVAIETKEVWLPMQAQALGDREQRCLRYPIGSHVGRRNLVAASTTLSASPRRAGWEYR